jgi:hypothetical protein
MVDPIHNLPPPMTPRKRARTPFERDGAVAPGPVSAWTLQTARTTAAPPAAPGRTVRDGFTMPDADFALIATLKARTVAARRETKKSELLRAGLHALAAMDKPAPMQFLGSLQAVKVGRPKKAG